MTSLGDINWGFINTAYSQYPSEPECGEVQVMEYNRFILYPKPEESHAQPKNPFWG